MSEPLGMTVASGGRSEEREQSMTEEAVNGWKS